jgi:hypothetical protein
LEDWLREVDSDDEGRGGVLVGVNTKSESEEAGGFKFGVEERSSVEVVVEGKFERSLEVGS